MTDRIGLFFGIDLVLLNIKSNIEDSSYHISRWQFK